MKDILFQKSIPEIKKFTFDLPVVQVFDDMVERSVPFYSEILTMSAELLKHFLSSKMTIYDVGCSTGNFASTLLKVFAKKPFYYVGIDNSPEMLLEASARHHEHKNITFKNLNLQKSNFVGANAVCLHYTLQFVDAAERISTLTKIFQALNSDGILILSEKILTKNNAFQQLHLNFKEKKGYSKLEIAQKRESLETVLVPLSLEKNIENLRQAGFEKIEVFFQWYNFASIFAQK